MLRSTLFFFLTIASQHSTVHAGLSEPPLDVESVPSLDMRAPTDPGMGSGTVIVPALILDSNLYIDCQTFFTQNPVSFNIGTNSVTCLAQGNSELSLTFNVIVFDCEAPKFTHCDLIGSEAVAAEGESSADVWYTPPPATDNDGSAPAVVCDPAPGSTFAMGVTPVTCNATDQAGNSVAIATHQVIVKAPAAPIIDPAPDMPCGPHELTDADDGSCHACPDGSVPAGDGTGCVFCEKGQVRGNQEGSAASGCVFAHGICDVWEKGVNGQCKDCPAGKIGKEDERGCKLCPSGTVRGNSAGNSLSGCVPANMVCDTDEIGVAGKCVGCAGGTAPNAEFSQCV